MKNITVFAGVYEFGNGSNTMRYRFYDPWSIDTTLVIEDTLFLQPHVKYDSLLTLLPYHEDFNSPSSFTLHKTEGQGDFIHNYNLGAFEGGGCGYMHTI